MLDSHINYPCAYWETADTLEQAKLDKMEFICRKLELVPGMTVPDIGCGWGGIARYAVEHHDVQVVGIMIFKEKQTWGRDQLIDLTLEVRRQDHRDIRGQFDRIVSVGMFEHVGYKNCPG